jgi:serine phosphatase RsbU (regulator of sigma subunit)/anti-sigma regulatory factor (Ser/Thr protein kinase)
MTEPKVQSFQPVALRISLPCNLAGVRMAAQTVSQFLERQCLAPDEIRACELALVEACNNAVQYAGANGAAPVRVDVLCESEAVELHVCDHTPGFDWPKEFVLPDADQERGRGLFLISSHMDEVSYLRGAESNRLLMRKQRLPSGSESLTSNPLTLEQMHHQARESEQVISDMAEELSFCYESLSAIFRCSAELGRTHDLKEFSQRLLSDLAQITSADWFVLRLMSRDGAKLTVTTASNPSWRLPALDVTAGARSGALELQAAQTRQDIWFERDAGLKRDDPLNATPVGCSGLIHPFSLGERLIGTVAVGKTPGAPPFTAVHANVVHTFADFLGIQIANARFQEDQVHARVVSRELEIAKNIQRSLLPKSLPVVPGFGLAGFCESAQQVGGDFYDVLAFSEGSLLLIVADVMGKGIPAAMFAAILRSLLRAVPEWTNQPAHLLSRVNRLLFKELSGVDMFITAQLVYVDVAEHRLVAASAGHCPMLLADCESGVIKVISPEGLPLGILPDTTFGAHVENLSPASRILLYTDGLTEARNAEGEFFGQDRMLGWFRERLNQQRSADDLKTELATDLARFRGSSPIQDDQTFLIMA